MKAIYIYNYNTRFDYHTRSDIVKESKLLLFVNNKSISSNIEAIKKRIKEAGDIQELSNTDIENLLLSNQTENREWNFIIDEL